MRLRFLAPLATAALIASTFAFSPTPTVNAAPAAAPCVPSVGPGIPAPTNVPSGIPGFHAHWYGQSGYPTLCPGGRSTAVVAYYNSGSAGWIRGRMGWAAYLGTWNTVPGQDQPSELGGNGQRGTPDTGWPEYNRIATQPADWVGPNQVAWFQFTIQAPTTPGHYRLSLRPLIEGATWMEDFGVFWVVTVLNPDGSPPPPPPAVFSRTGYSFLSVPTPRGTFNVHLIKEARSQVTVKTLTANSSDCFNNCPAKPLAQYVAENNGYAGMNGSYFCPPDYAPCAGKVNSFDYAVYNTNLGGWINSRAINSVNGLAVFNGSAATFYRRGSTYSAAPGPVTAAISNYPLLLQAGAVVNSESEQSASQMARGTRGAIGVDGSYVFLAVVSGASVTEAAYALQALGVREALNLDGGGSTAMYIAGSYRVGPGRLLPNAIVLTKP
jgi:uncharacterized protein YigE (DUF2233 family)